MMSYLRKSKLEVAVTVLSGKHPSALRSSSFFKVNVPTKTIYLLVMTVLEEIPN